MRRRFLLSVGRLNLRCGECFAYRSILIALGRAQTLPFHSTNSLLSKCFRRARFYANTSILFYRRSPSKPGFGFPSLLPSRCRNPSGGPMRHWLVYRPCLVCRGPFLWRRRFYPSLSPHFLLSLWFAERFVRPRLRGRRERRLR